MEEEYHYIYHIVVDNTIVETYDDEGLALKRAEDLGGYVCTLKVVDI